MSFGDKVSWVGGMLGLFTGFSLISGFEILYWLWFKVILHDKDTAAVAPDTNTINVQVRKLLIVIMRIVIIIIDNLVLGILKESKAGKNEFVESKNNLILQKLVREVEELKSWKKRLEPHKD